MKKKIYFLLTILIFTSIQDVNTLEYVGCFVDDQVDTQVWHMEHFQGSGYTTEQCKEECGLSQYIYAGLSNYDECYCSNTYDEVQLTQESECIFPCTQESMEERQICGGYERMTVYHTENNCSNCTTHLDFDTCNNYNAGLNLENLTNDCYAFSVESLYHYNITLQFNNDFKFDKNCVSMILQFQDKEVPMLEYDGTNYYQGSTALTNIPLMHGAYLPDEDRIWFVLPHQEFMPNDCGYWENSEEYIWQCDLKLRVYFMGTEQFRYEFIMKTYLKRYTENNQQSTVPDGGNGGGCPPPFLSCLPPLPPPFPPEITGDPTPAYVQGKCCKLSLTVQSDLLFCLDGMACTQRTDNTQVIERLDVVTVVHIITTEEFKVYYLNDIRISIGSFVPEIINLDGTNKAEIIYQFVANIALDNMVIQAISMLSETPAVWPKNTQQRMLMDSNNKIRILQESSQAENYLNAQNVLTIQENVESYINNNNKIQNNKNKNTNNNNENNNNKNNTLIIILAASIGVVIITLSVIVACYYLRQNPNTTKKSNKQNMQISKQQLKNPQPQSSNNSGIQNSEVQVQMDSSKPYNQTNNKGQKQNQPQDSQRKMKDVDFNNDYIERMDSQPSQQNI